MHIISPLDNSHTPDNMVREMINHSIVYRRYWIHWLNIGCRDRSCDDCHDNDHDLRGDELVDIDLLLLGGVLPLSRMVVLALDPVVNNASLYPYPV